MNPALFRLAIRALPTRAAARLTVALSNRSIRVPVPEAQELALACGETFRFGPGDALAGWRWGEGPTVVLVHGWGGSAAQMAPMAMAIAAAGFRAVAFDVTGHGSSAGKSTAWSFFVRDTASLAQMLGQPAYAYVGHSAGGLSTIVARSHKRVRASHFACISAPSHPYPPVNAVRRRLDPPEAVLRAYQDYLAGELGFSWRELEVGVPFRGLGRNLLLVYAEDDRYIEHGEGDLIAGLCPGATLAKTGGGHTGILASAQTHRAVVEFLLGKLTV